MRSVPLSVVQLFYVLILLDTCIAGWHNTTWSPPSDKEHGFCAMSLSHSSNRYLSYLSHQYGVIRLVQSMWDAQNRLVKCSFTSDKTVTDAYQTFCREGAQNHANKGWFQWNQRLDLLQFARNLDANPELCSNAAATWWTHNGVGRVRRAVGEKIVVDESQSKKTNSVNPQEEKSMGSDLMEEAGRRRTKRGVTFPGTLWCGAGSSATNFTELGMFRETDKCCRKHDHCKHLIPSFDYNYGVFNYRLYTISLCSCDFRFKQCLLNQNDTISTIVGVTYFNILQIPCFALQNKRRCPRNSNCKYKKVQVATVRYQGSYNYTHPYQDEWDQYYRARSPNRHRHLNATRLSLPEITSKNSPSKDGSKKAYETKEVITTVSPSAEDSNVETVFDMPSGDKADEDSQPDVYVVRTTNLAVPDKKTQPTNSVYSEIFSKHKPENASLPPLNTSETFLYHVPENITHSPLNTYENFTQNILNASEHLLYHVSENSSLLPLNTSEIFLHSASENISLSLLNTPDTLHSVPENSSLSPLNTSATSLHHVAENISPLPLNISKASHHSLTAQEPTSSVLLISKSSYPSTSRESESAHSMLPTVSESTTLRPVLGLGSTLSLPALWLGKENRSHVHEGENDLAHQNTSRSRNHFKDLGGADAEFTRIKQQLNNRYISKSCGCYRRFDECEYKIAPNDILFHLQNLDKTTLYHCNCTRRLARQLRKMKGLNEVEAVVPQYVSPLCFNLRYSTTCTSTEGCTKNTTAILAEARHLQRAIKYRKRRKHLAVSLKVKRHGDVASEERVPKPVRLYDKCLQITQASQSKD